MNTRGIALIAASIVLSGGLIGVQLAAGGSDFKPTPTADPCQARPATVQSGDTLDSLAQAVVLTGLDGAACELGVSREQLVLSLADPQQRAQLLQDAGTTEQGLADAIKAGLLKGVDQLDQSGRLPSASALLPSIAAELGIPQGLVDLVPSSAVDRVVSTGQVLRWSLEQIDVATVLDQVEAGAPLDEVLRDAVIEGAKQRLSEQLSGVLGR